MTRLSLVPLALIVLSAASIAQNGTLALLREKTEAAIREIAGKTRGIVGLTLVDIKTGQRLGIRETEVFPTASAIKVTILMEVYRQAHEGKFKLTDRKTVDRAQMVDGGILCSLGDKTAEMSIRDLCVLMIVLSDNTATNILIRLVGMDNINKNLQSLGFANTKLRRFMMDTKASAHGDENVATPAEAASILQLLQKGDFIGKAECEDMLSILKITKLGNIRSAVPEDVPVAFKQGELPGVLTEWAIVDLKDRPYILIIMENYGLETEAATAMKEISKVAYDYFWRLGHSTPYGIYSDPALWK